MRLGAGSGGRRVGDGAANVLEELDVVELDVEALDDPVGSTLGGAEDGDTADGLGDAAGDEREGSGPDERDAVAVPWSDLGDLEVGEVVGSCGLMGKEGSLGGEDGEAGLELSEEVDGVGPVNERVVVEVGSPLVLPVAEHALVGVQELIDVALAQALLGLGADLDDAAITASDSGGANRGGGSRGREGQGGESSEETHCEY